MNPTFIKNNPLIVSILLFITIFILIQIAKPGFLYNRNGGIRVFGISYKNKTIFPIWLLSIILGILCYTFVRFYIQF
jgi:hypothetical protein